MLPLGECVNEAGLEVLLGKEKCLLPSRSEDRTLSCQNRSLSFPILPPFCPDHYSGSGHEGMAHFWEHLHSVIKWLPKVYGPGGNEGERELDSQSVVEYSDQFHGPQWCGWKQLISNLKKYQQW